MPEYLLCTPDGGYVVTCIRRTHAVARRRQQPICRCGCVWLFARRKWRENTKALQRAVDLGGTITVSRPGIYKVAGTVFVGSNTTLYFGNGVFLKKVAEPDAFTHVLLNKGALTKTYDEHIAIEGLQSIVNGVDMRNFLVVGQHGQLAFFYVKDLRIEHFRCLDLGKGNGNAMEPATICTLLATAKKNI